MLYRQRGNPWASPENIEDQTTNLGVRGSNPFGRAIYLNLWVDFPSIIGRNWPNCAILRTGNQIFAMVLRPAAERSEMAESGGRFWRELATPSYHRDWQNRRVRLPALDVSFHPDWHHLIAVYEGT